MPICEGCKKELDKGSIAATHPYVGLGLQTVCIACAATPRRCTCKTCERGGGPFPATPVWFPYKKRGLYGLHSRCRKCFGVSVRDSQNKARDKRRELLGVSA